MWGSPVPCRPRAVVLKPRGLCSWRLLGKLAMSSSAKARSGSELHAAAGCPHTRPVWVVPPCYECESASKLAGNVDRSSQLLMHAKVWSRCLIFTPQRPQVYPNKRFNYRVATVLVDGSIMRHSGRGWDGGKCFSVSRTLAHFVFLGMANDPSISYVCLDTNQAI